MIIHIERRPPQSPIHVIWGIFAIGVVVSAGLVGEYLNLLPACVFREATGVPCLTCGATRSVAALSDFQLAQAFSYNPLAMFFPMALVLFSLSVALGMLFKRRLAIRLTANESFLLRILIAAAVMANWAYLIIYLR